MNNTHAKVPAQRDPRGSFGLLGWGVVVVAVVLGVSILAGLHFRHHLLWRYQASRLGLENVQRISDSPMPESPTPSDWVRYQIGVIEISLPPELAQTASQPSDQSEIVFHHGSRLVWVHQPEDMSKDSARLQSATELSPDPEQFTSMKLHRACYQVDSGDFRWSMTSDEVKWHAFCIVASQFIRTGGNNGRTESFSRPNLDGFVHLVDDRGYLIWESRDHTWGGHIVIAETDEQANSAWIRTVCQSLRLRDESVADPD